MKKFFSHQYSTLRAAAFLLTAGMFLLSACSGTEEESQVSILKDGKIESMIVESFDKAYYNQEELKQRILQEASDYNRMEEKEAVSVEKVEVNEGAVVVKMTYDTASHYASFNGGIFFLGTVLEAQEAGYDLNMVLSSVKDHLVTVGKSDILSMTDMQILITDMKEPVSLNGKAAYISGNAAADESLKRIFFEAESKEPACVIFK